MKPVKVGAIVVVGVAAASVAVLFVQQPAADREIAPRAPAAFAVRPAPEAPRLTPPRAAPQPPREVAAPAAAPAPRPEDADQAQLAAEAQRTETARKIAAGPASETMAALRGDAELARAVADSLLEDTAQLSDHDTVAALLTLALDATASGEARSLALELLGAAPGADAETVSRLGSLATGDAEVDLRRAAIAAIRQLSTDREDLAAPTRAALLESAAKAPTPEDRADALDAIRADGATEADVTRLASYLANPEAEVRAAAARSLAGSDASVRAPVCQALERAFATESDPDAAAAMVATAIRAARADAPALLVKLAAAPIAQNNPGIGRQIDDYRSLLAAGETDPARILAAREEREDARLALATNQE